MGNATTDRIAGKAKEVAGKATGDHATEAEGFLQQVAGKAKDALDTVAEATEPAREAIAEKAEAAKDAVTDKINGLTNEAAQGRDHEAR